MTQNEQALTLTLELIDPANGNVAHTYSDSTLIPLLRRSYGVDVLSALPQEALTQNWDATAVLSLCSTAKAKVEQGDSLRAAPALQPVTKFEDELTPMDVEHIKFSPFHTDGSLDNRTTITYMEPVPVVGNPYTTGVLTDLATLTDFCTEATQGSYLLRDSAFIPVPGAVSSSLEEEEGAEVAAELVVS